MLDSYYNEELYHENAIESDTNCEVQKNFHNSSGHNVRINQTVMTSVFCVVDKWSQVQ